MRGRGGCRTVNSPLAFIRYMLQHCLALIEDIAVGKSNDRVAQPVQVRGAGLIVFDLLSVGIVIDLDAESGFIIDFYLR